jgi:hypothetical protein
VNVDTEYAALAARILRPEAPRLDEVRATASTCADARELWERLAARSVIDPAWLDDPRREFCVVEPDLLGSYVNGRRAVTSTPSMVAAITLGADAEGVVTAESLAREIAAGLASWRGHQPDRVCWWVPSRVTSTAASARREISPIVTRSPTLRAYYALTIAQTRTSRSAARVDLTKVSRAARAARCSLGLAQQLATDLESQRQWQIAVEDGWRYNGVEFARLSCPFRALLALWERGYVLVDIDAKAVTLGARTL